MRLRSDDPLLSPAPPDQQLPGRGSMRRACKLWLGRRHVSPTERAILRVAVEHGDGIMSFAELRRGVYRALGITAP